MTKKETAEQKLLKIIETQGASPAAGGNQPASASQPSPARQVAGSVKGTGLPNFSMPLFLNSFGNFFKGTSFAPNAAVSFGLKEVNYLFLAGIFVTAGIFVLNIFGGMRLLQYQPKASVGTPVLDPSDNFVPAFREISQYLENIQRRNIFKPFEKKEEIKVEVPVVEVSLLSAKLKDLKLVGISWLDSAESASAMIEDTTSGITYFLSAGEKIRDVSVKVIYSDSIVVTYQGEESVLRL